MDDLLYEAFEYEAQNALNEIKEIIPDPKEHHDTSRIRRLFTRASKASKILNEDHHAGTNAYRHLVETFTDSISEDEPLDKELAGLILEGIPHLESMLQSKLQHHTRDTSALYARIANNGIKRETTKRFEPKSVTMQEARRLSDIVMQYLPQFRHDDLKSDALVILLRAMIDDLEQVYWNIRRQTDFNIPPLNEEFAEFLRHLGRFLNADQIEQFLYKLDRVECCLLYFAQCFARDSEARPTSDVALAWIRQRCAELIGE